MWKSGAAATPSTDVALTRHARHHARQAQRMDITRALVLMDGAARRSDLLAMGVPERSITRAVREGKVVRYAPGCYAFVTAPVAVMRAVQFRASIGCLSACQDAGLALWDTPDVPHLIVPKDRSASRRPAADLESVELHRLDEPLASGLWTPPRRAIDQASRCCTPLAHLVLIESALSAGLLRPDDLMSMALGTARRRTWLSRWASALSESPLETVARVGLLCAGLHVEQQVEVVDVGRVDMLVEGVLIVEADGWGFHADRNAFENDRHRDGVALELGIPVLRFTSRMLRADLAAVVRRVAAVVGRRPRANFEAQLAWFEGSSEFSGRRARLRQARRASREHHDVRRAA